MPTRDPSSLDRQLPLPLPVFHVLLALSDKERHAQDLKADILQSTNGSLNLSPAAFHDVLHKLIAQTFVVEASDKVDPKLDPVRRRYYAITPIGRRILQAETARLAGLVALAKARLGLTKNAGARDGG